MKRIIKYSLLLICIFLICFCGYMLFQNLTAIPWDLPYMVQVDGTLYINIGEIYFGEPDAGAIRGYISSYVDLQQYPQKNNQSNFSQAEHQPYAIVDNTLYVYYSGEWHKFIPHKAQAHSGK